jgi:putative DNA primase/helicase
MLNTTQTIPDQIQTNNFALMMEKKFSVEGTADQWRDRVGVLCAGNSRLVFAVACAFAGPLMRPAGAFTSGVHIFGETSTGKTTALKVAASVNGGPDSLQYWRTDKDLEAIAAQHSDSLLVLDEFARLTPKEAGESACMLAIETGRARATRNGAPRPRLSWRLLCLSSGDVSFAKYTRPNKHQTSRITKTGRVIDLPADAGAGFGILENLHGMAGGSEFSRHIVEQAGRCYGGPGRAWLQWLTENAHVVKDELRQRIEAMDSRMVPHGFDGHVKCASLRFALVAVAGEMATAAGLTGWEPGESEQAAITCFNAWMASAGAHCLD